MQTTQIIWTVFPPKVNKFLSIRVTGNVCGKGANDMMSHSCCRFVDSTSMMRISSSTTSHWFAFGLRFGGYGTVPQDTSINKKLSTEQLQLQINIINSCNIIISPYFFSFFDWCFFGFLHTFFSYMLVL